MLLSAFAKDSFDALVRIRGKDYYERGLVQINNFSAYAIRATVFGTHHYTVKLSWSNASRQAPKLISSCSCPYFQDSGNCKHIWATLLTVDHTAFSETYEADLGTRYLAPAEVPNDPDSSSDCSSEEHILESPFAPPFEPAYKSKNSLPNRQWQQLFHFLELNEKSSPNTQTFTPKQEHNSQFWFVLEKNFFQDESVIKFYKQKKSKNGWGKLQPVGIRSDTLNSLTTHPDKEFIEMLLTFPSSTINNSYYRYHEPQKHDAIIPPHFCLTVFSKLCESGKLLIESPQDTFTAISWNPHSEVKCKIQIAATSDPANYTFKPVFSRGDEWIDVSHVSFLSSAGIILIGNELSYWSPKSLSPLLAALVTHGPQVVPKEQLSELLNHLLGHVDFENLILPEELPLEIIYLTPHPEIVFTSQSSRTGMLYSGDLLFKYETTLPLSTQHSFELNSSQRIIKILLEENKIFIRNTDLEQQQIKALQEILKPVPHEFFQSLFIVDRVLFSILPELIKNGWTIWLERKKVQTISTFDFSIKSGEDWFDLKLQLDQQTVNLQSPAFLASLKTQSALIQISETDVGFITPQWQNKILRLLELGKLKNGKLHFNLSQSIFIDSLLEEKLIHADAHYLQHRNKLSAVNGVKSQRESKQFKGQLRPYQREGLGWLKFLQQINLGGCLADDMGLGKTIQVLALLVDKNLDQAPLPSLIVAPKSVIENWIQEAKKFTPSLHFACYDGVYRNNPESWKGIDVFVVTYGLLRQDIMGLKEHLFDYVILDEAHTIKNKQAITSKASKILKANHRLALTGTPIENHLGELFSIFEFLNPGLISPAMSNEARNGLSDTVQYVMQGLRPLILRRKKEEVLKDLPPKNELILKCELEGEHKQIYEDLRNYYWSALNKTIDEKGWSQSKIHVLEGLLRLRQAACHPQLIKKDSPDLSSVKIDILLEKVIELIEGNHKALIFSQFTSLLKIVARELTARNIKFEYLDGKTQNRMERVEHFQNDSQCPIFLISLKAGGLGLNLTAADYCFLLDPWWNPAAEAQAIDRAHRIGQDKKVIAYRLIAQDTVEEKILNLQNRKKELANALMSADKGFLRKLSLEDFKYLLS